MALAEGNVNLAQPWLCIPPRSRKAVIPTVLSKFTRELGREKELRLVDLNNLKLAPVTHLLPP